MDTELQFVRDALPSAVGFLGVLFRINSWTSLGSRSLTVGWTFGSKKV
jgi:hypothetical protein